MTLSNSPPLRVWILQNGEELPSDPGPPRLLRQGILAETLAARGHDVTYWTSTFNHQQKFQRSESLTTYDEVGGYRVTLLPAHGYAGHISAQRIRSHQQAAAGFRRVAKGLEPPDVVISGYPTIEFAYSGVKYALSRGLPSMVDFRDQWPDIIRQRLPRSARPAAYPLLRHWSQMQRYAVRHATAVVGISDEFVNWALTAGNRTRGDLDRAFHLAPPVRRLAPEQGADANAFWERTVGPKPIGHIWGVYAGNLSSRTDIATVAEATRLLSSQTRGRLKIIICGRGDSESALRDIARDNPALLVAGQRNAAEVHEILRRADFGIVPYLNSSDFLMSYPNKLGEQLAHGLPILIGLGGITGALLARHDLAIPYAATDARSCASALHKLVATGISKQQADRARIVYHDQFNPTHIYPAFARHVEQVASNPPLQSVRSSVRGR